MSGVLIAAEQNLSVAQPLHAGNDKLRRVQTEQPLRRLLLLRGMRGVLMVCFRRVIALCQLGKFIVRCIERQRVFHFPFAEQLRILRIERTGTRRSVSGHGANRAAPADGAQQRYGKLCAAFAVRGFIFQKPCAHKYQPLLSVLQIDKAFLRIAAAFCLDPRLRLWLPSANGVWFYGEDGIGKAFVAGKSGWEMHPQAMIAYAICNFQMKPQQRVVLPQADRQAERLLRLVRLAAVSPVQNGAAAKRALLDTDGRRAGRRVPNLRGKLRRKQVCVADIGFVGEEIQSPICRAAALILDIQRSVRMDTDVQIFVFQRLKADDRPLRQRQRYDGRTVVQLMAA